MKIQIENDLAYVRTPYHPNFVSKIKRCSSAKWDATRQAWQVKADLVPVVRKLMVDIFGESDIPAEGKRFDVWITFNTAVYADREGVYFFGKCLARARGRDSGARPGDGVCYISGGCRSGGSMKYWESIVNDGSIVVIYDVPETLILNEKHLEGVEYEFIERVANQDELNAEKARLMARIKEIDTILGAS